MWGETPPGRKGNKMEELDEKVIYKCEMAALLIIKKSLGALTTDVFEILSAVIKYLVKEDMFDQDLGANALCWKFLMNYSFKQDRENKNIYHIEPFVFDKPQMIVNSTMPDLVFSNSTCLKGDIYV